MNNFSTFALLLFMLFFVTCSIPINEDVIEDEPHNIKKRQWGFSPFGFRRPYGLGGYGYHHHYHRPYYYRHPYYHHYHGFWG
uniref:Sulfur globule protein CV3 n=1 Tax=Trichuris muris TaxID=70415 RepID=A0A5S6QXH4_TRIMR